MLVGDNRPSLNYAPPSEDHRDHLLHGKRKALNVVAFTVADRTTLASYLGSALS